MKYLYKNGENYLYKRRLPNTQGFFTFNTQTKNAKIAGKITNRFNRLSYDLFEYLKKEGNLLALDFDEVFTLLSDYKDKALVEHNNTLESTRHKHLENLFGIKKEDPIMGTILLDGSDKRVIQKALDSFENLAHCDMYTHKKPLLKIGKEIVKRSSIEVKSLYAKIRNNEQDLLTFLSMLIKAESEILKDDYTRAEQRFNPKHSSTQNSNPTAQRSHQETSYLVNQKKHYTVLEDLIEEYLFSECLYDRKDLENSKTQCSKMNKVIELFIDFAKSRKIFTVHELSIQTIKDTYGLIVDIPKKRGNINQGYRYFEYYLKFKTVKTEKRAKSTIGTEMLNFNRFVIYMKKKKYISLEDYEDIQNHYRNVKKALDKAVKYIEISIQNRLAI